MFQPGWPAFPALCPVRVRSFHVLLSHHPFLHNLLRRLLPPSFGCFAGTTMMYDSLLPCMQDLCFWLSPTGPRLVPRGRQQGLSVLARGVSMRAWGLRLRRAAPHSRNARRNVAFRVVLPRRRPRCLFSELNGQPTYTPVQRFKCVLTVRPRMARGQDGSLLLSCMTLSFTTPRRFIPTLSELFEQNSHSRLNVLWLVRDQV